MGEIPWLRRKIEVGDTIGPGLTAVSLPDLGTMRVKALLSDVDDGRVVAGMKAVCTIDAYAEHPMEGTVREVSPVAREPNQTSQRRAFDVIVDLHETDRERMLPGLSVKIEIAGRRAHDAILVPRSTIDFDAAPAHVRSVDGRTVAVDVDLCDAQRCALRPGPMPRAPCRRGLPCAPRETRREVGSPAPARSPRSRRSARSRARAHRVRPRTGSPRARTT